MINKYCYWIIQLTWGILTTLVGALITLILKLKRNKTYKNGYGFITTVGGDWGGLSLGPFAFCGKYNEQNTGYYCYNPYWYEHTRRHEFGHSIQVLFLGPLWIFIVAIPSSIRYWYYRIGTKKGKWFEINWYDSVWFERTATLYGTIWIERIEKEK